MINLCIDFLFIYLFIYLFIFLGDRNTNSVFALSTLQLIIESG